MRQVKTKRITTAALGLGIIAMIWLGTATTRAEEPAEPPPGIIVAPKDGNVVKDGRVRSGPDATVPQFVSIANGKVTILSLTIGPPEGWSFIPFPYTDPLSFADVDATGNLSGFIGDEVYDWYDPVTRHLEGFRVYAIFDESSLPDAGQFPLQAEGNMEPPPGGTEPKTWYWAIKTGVFSMKFIKQDNSPVPLTGGGACLMVSKRITAWYPPASGTSDNLPPTATFDGPPGNEPDRDTFRLEGKVPDGFSGTPTARITILRNGNSTGTFTYDMVHEGSIWRTDKHIRLVARTEDDAVQESQTIPVALGDEVKGELLIGANTVAEAKYPVCRPQTEDYLTAIRTVRIHSIILDYSDVKTKANPEQTLEDLNSVYAQMGVRFSNVSTVTQPPVKNIIAVENIATAPGNFSATIDGVPVGPFAILPGSASLVADQIAVGINGILGAGTASAFRSVPVLNKALVVIKKGHNVEIANIVEDIPNVHIFDPQINTVDDLVDDNWEAQAISANYSDMNSATLDVIYVKSCPATAFAVPYILTGNDSNWASGIVLSVQDVIPVNFLKRAHEAGHVLLNTLSHDGTTQRVMPLDGWRFTDQEHQRTRDTTNNPSTVLLHKE
ncbi:MAG: hypothetical protein ACYC26_13310 [Phycisphaerales bacterium]